MTPKLLSICIPTYNRAPMLERALERLFADPDFDHSRIEVVVSDNASTDNTAEVVARYPAAGYFRNESNIGANANFTVLLGRASGRYLRLMNDTMTLLPGMLGKMLAAIEAADPACENLCFLKSNTPAELTTRGKEQFLGAVSFNITWIACFGAWREDFERVEDKDRFVVQMLNQVDWALQIAGNGKPTRIIADDLFTIEEASKGGYDFFTIFITHYLAILKFHHIGRWSFAREKFRLLRDFILPFLRAQNQYKISVANGSVMTHRYWYEPYYLPLRLLYRLKNLRRR